MTPSVAWKTGRIEPWWNLEHQSLPYVHESFNNEQDVKLWREIGFTQQRFTGDLYDMRFPEPAWIHPFRDHMHMQNFSWSVYRMAPGDALPLHGDTYARFCDVYGLDDVDLIIRYIVFLEPWQSGHYFEIDGTAVVAWQAGDWVCWRGATPHMAANLGNSMRYTLQLTGLIDAVS